MFENGKDDVDSLNEAGQKLVHSVDHQLVNSSPVQDQLSALNASYKDLYDKLEAEELKLEQVQGSFSFVKFPLPVLHLSTSNTVKSENYSLWNWASADRLRCQRQTRFWSFFCDFFQTLFTVEFSLDFSVFDGTMASDEAVLLFREAAFTPANFPDGCTW